MLDILYAVVDGLGGCCNVTGKFLEKVNVPRSFLAQDLHQLHCSSKRDKTSGTILKSNSNTADVMPFSAQICLWSPAHLIVHKADLNFKCDRRKF